MTTAQRMFIAAPHRHPTVRAAIAWCVPAILLVAALTLIAFVVGGCGAFEKSAQSVPAPDSPYGAPAVIAVAPCRNETGTTVFDELEFTDALVEQLQDVKGMVVLPTNRTLGAMRALRLGSIDTPSQAFALASALGADALVVSTATAWEPYDPPKIGLVVALFARTDRVGGRLSASRTDPQELQEAATDGGGSVESFDSGPSALVSAMLDGADTATRERIKRYAEGRYDPVSGLGWRRYTASMRLFAKFACFDTVEQLIALERSRLAGLGARQEMAQHR